MRERTVDVSEGAAHGVIETKVDDLVELRGQFAAPIYFRRSFGNGFHLHIQADTQQICALPKVVALTIHLHIQADTQQICALRRWLLLPFTCTSRPTPNKFALSEGGCSYHSLAHSRPTPNKFALSEGGCSYHSLAHPGRLPIKFALSEGGCSYHSLAHPGRLPTNLRPTPNKFALSEGGCSYHSLAHPGRHPTNLRSPKVVALTIHLQIQADTPTNLRSPRVVALNIHLHIQADTQQICALRRWLLLPFTCTSRPTPHNFSLSGGGCSYHSLAHPGRHPTNLRSPKVVALTIHLHIQADT